MYCSACREIQIFELDVMGNCFDSGCQRWSFQIILEPEVHWIGTTTTACQRFVHAWSDEMYCSAVETPKHSNLLRCKKICSAEQFWNQRCIGLEQLRQPVSAMCTRGQRRWIARPVETPRHSNLMCLKKFVLSNNFGTRGALDWNKYDSLSVLSA